MTTQQKQTDGQDGYISSYNNIEVHRLMINDRARTEAYRDAILKNDHLFSGKVVMDVGAGTGILSLFMAQAGARKVFAVEASNLACTIPDIAKVNGFSDVITTFHSKIESIQLPDNEKVDVIVAEWMGFYLFHESMLASVLYARDKFLSEGGVMFPSTAELVACPASLESLYQEQYNCWDNVYGFDMSPLKNYINATKSSKPDIYTVNSSDLLSDPAPVKFIDLHYVTLDEIRDFTSSNFVGISKDGNFEGLVLWFDCQFDGRRYDEKGDEFGSLVSLSTSPFNPKTHWKQTVIAFGRHDNDLDINAVEKDEVVGWKICFEQDKVNEICYNISLEILDSENSEHPIPCLCPNPKCVIISKIIESENISEHLELDT